MSHLTLMSWKPKNANKDEFKEDHKIILIKKLYQLCDNFDCMPCKMNLIASYLYVKKQLMHVA